MINVYTGMCIKILVNFVRLVFELMSTLWYHLFNLSKIKYFWHCWDDFFFYFGVSIICFNHKQQQQPTHNVTNHDKSTFAKFHFLPQKSRWSGGWSRYFGYHLYLSVENNCENLKKIVRSIRKPVFILKHRIYLFGTYNIYIIIVYGFSQWFFLTRKDMAEPYLRW